MDRLQRAAEQHARDITNIWRRLGVPVGDLSSDTDTNSGASTVIGTLASTLSRNGSATLTLYGGSASGGIGSATGGTASVVDIGAMPGTIALKVGAKLKATRLASGLYVAEIPGWIYMLRGTTPGSAVTSGSTGSVVLANSLGTVATRNPYTASTATSKVCYVKWNEPAEEWEFLLWEC